MMTGVLTLEALSRALASHEPLEAEADGRTRAAVVLLLCPTTDAHVDLLIIERSRHESDPWSGHLAFPGGKVEPGDPNLRAAVARETREEIGIDLSAVATCIGQLDDESASIMPLIVSAFVYHVPTFPPVVLGDEVERSFWFPLHDLGDPARQTWHLHGEGRSRYAAIDLRLPETPLLWGVTYRFVVQLLEIEGLSSQRRIR